MLFDCTALKHCDTCVWLGRIHFSKLSVNYENYNNPRDRPIECQKMKDLRGKTQGTYMYTIILKPQKPEQEDPDMTSSGRDFIKQVIVLH